MSDRCLGVLRSLTGACASFGRHTTEQRGRVVVTSPLSIAGSSVLHFNSSFPNSFTRLSCDFPFEACGGVISEKKPDGRTAATYPS